MVEHIRDLRTVRRGVAALAATLASGCGGSGPRPEPGAWCPPPDLEGAGVAAEVTVAIVDPVRVDHAPRPVNDSEALVFRFLYEGLTDLDCAGEPTPALASAWLTDDGGQHWVFTLREGARFADGRPVTGDDVRDAWHESRRSARDDPARFALWQDVRLRDLMADSTHVELRLAAPDPELPRLLAAPEFRVCAPVPQGLPLGTLGRALQERIENGRKVWSAPGGRVRFVYWPDADPRDAFLPSTDAVVTRRNAALEHFATLPGVRLVPLPWSRVYVLTATPAWPAGPDDSTRTELATQVLPANARPAEVPWLDAMGTGTPAPVERTVPDKPSARGLLAPRGDPDALALAERVGSLWARSGGPVVVTPRDPEDVAVAMAEGGVPGVLALPRDLASGVHQARRLEALAPPGTALPQPLVCTRATLVLRGDLTGITWGWDGVPRLDAVGRRPGGSP